MTDDPLPDPVAYARDLPEEKLLEYKKIFGEESREWVIAQQELARRRYPVWAKLLWTSVAIAVGIWVIVKLFR
jgi:hypothetical protein